MVTELDAGVDWLTLTTDTQVGKRQLRQLSEALVFGGEGKVRAWRLLKYIGRQAHYPDGTGGAAYGENLEACQSILQVWGAAANDILPDVLELKARSTRVDYAVTVLHDAPQPPVLARYDELMKQRSQFMLLVPVNNGGGGTLYVGSRTSDLFGRLYDKGAQLAIPGLPPRVMWRYEVEYKRDSAAQALALMKRSSAEVGARRTAIVGNVERFFREHGVDVPFGPGSTDLSSIIRYSTRVRDDVKTLQWLANQVQPALHRLESAGLREKALVALGLTFEESLAGDAPDDRQLRLW